jgi:hypothetical protein
MANAEVAKLIADNLHQLPHPKHGEIRLMGYRPFNLSQQPKDRRERINGHAQSIGEATVELIERNGGTIINSDELRRLRATVALQDPGRKVAHGYCAHCGSEIIRLLVDDELNAKLHRVAQEAAGFTHHHCWDGKP